MNEWVDEWMNEWVNEWVSGRRHYLHLCLKFPLQLHSMISDPFLSHLLFHALLRKSLLRYGNTLPFHPASLRTLPFDQHFDHWKYNLCLQTEEMYLVFQPWDALAPTILYPMITPMSSSLTPFVLLIYLILATRRYWVRTICCGTSTHHLQPTRWQRDRLVLKMT